MKGSYSVKVRYKKLKKNFFFLQRMSKLNKFINNINN
jgi:hypothetical protein